MQISKLDVDILTGGEKIYYKLDMVEFIAKAPWILRPANYPMGDPGRGIRSVEICGKTVVVINLLGTSGFSKVHLNNPFLLAETLVDKARDENKDPIILVQFHETTVSRIANAKYIDTDWGIVPIKSLFSNAVGEEGQSKNSVKEIIREIILKNQSGKALSDQKIADMTKKPPGPSSLRKMAQCSSAGSPSFAKRKARAVFLS